jgi:hypothetical protein
MTHPGRCPAPPSRSAASTTWTTSAGSPTPTTWNCWNSPRLWTTPPRSSWTPAAADSTSRNASRPRPPSRWPGSPGSTGRRRPLPARPRRVPPAAPGLPPVHGPPRHHRAHRLPPAAAPDRLPPPPALDGPGRPHPRRPARHRPAPPRSSRRSAATSPCCTTTRGRTSRPPSAPPPRPSTRPSAAAPGSRVSSVIELPSCQLIVLVQCCLPSDFPRFTASPLPTRTFLQPGSLQEAPAGLRSE